MPLVRPDTLPGLGVPQGRHLVLGRCEHEVSVIVVQHARDGTLMALQQNRPLQPEPAQTRSTCHRITSHGDQNTKRDHSHHIQSASKK